MKSLVGVVAGALSIGGIAPAQPEHDATDLIVTNAKVYTVDAERPNVTAFAIRGGWSPVAHFGGYQQPTEAR